MLSSVVLPAPFGPTTATTSPSLTCSETLAQRRDRAVASCDPFDLEHGVAAAAGRRQDGAMKVGRNASTKAGLPPSTVRMTTSFSGTPFVPA